MTVRRLVDWRFLAQTLWPGAALLALVGLLFHDLPAGYWRADDPALLLHALQSGGLQAFYDPQDWQKLSPSNLTPWITASFKIDLWLAGLSPRFFYLHQIFSLWLVALAIFALMREWLPAAWACAAAGLFLVGPPAVSVTELLMTRHYLEGLLFALLSLLSFVHAVRRRSLLLACSSAVLYALAASAKEVYVPLVAVMLALPAAGGWRERLRRAAPSLLVAALYVPWRAYMLDSTVGGYVGGRSMLSAQAVTGLVHEIGRFPGYLFGSWWAWPTAVLLAALGFALARRPRLLVFAGVLAGSVVLPLVPLVSFPGINGPDRYLFVPWAAVSTAFVLLTFQAISHLRRPAIRRALAAPVLLLAAVPAAVHSREMMPDWHASYLEFEAQGRFLAEADEAHGFLPTGKLQAAYWYVTSMCEIRRIVESSRCPVPLIKGLPMDRTIDRLHQYDPATGAMSDISGRMDSEVRRLADVDRSRPLHAQARFDGGILQWQFGPYGAGQYYAASPRIGRVPVARVGELKLAHPAFEFHVQYDDPAGWTTSSPLLQVTRERPLSWRRQ